MWRDLIDNSLASPTTSDFIRQVLSDYQITDAEYQEARGRFVACMADRGWLVVLGERGYTVSAKTGGPHEGAGYGHQPGPEEDNGQCSMSTFHVIELVYLGMKHNPQGLEYEELIRQCFIEHGVPDGAGLSYEEFFHMVYDKSYRPSSDQARLCIDDPDGQNGLTLEDVKGR